VEITEICLIRENRTLCRSLKNLMLIFFKDRLVLCTKKIQHPLICSAETTKGIGHPIYSKKAETQRASAFAFIIAEDFILR